MEWVQSSTVAQSECRSAVRSESFSVFPDVFVSCCISRHPLDGTVGGRADKLCEKRLCVEKKLRGYGGLWGGQRKGRKKEQGERAEEKVV